MSTTYEDEIEVGQDAYGYDIQMQCTDGQGEPFDLTGYTVQWQVTERNQSTPKFTGNCSIVDAGQGKIKYTVVQGNFDIEDKIYSTLILATKTGTAINFDAPVVICWSKTSGSRDFCDEVRGLVNLTETQIGYVDVWLLVQKAIEYASGELGQTLTFPISDADQRLLVKDLAAVAAALKVSGGASSGSTFTLGDFSVKTETSTQTEASSNIANLQKEIIRLFDLLREVPFKVAQA